MAQSDAGQYLASLWSDEIVAMCKTPYEPAPQTAEVTLDSLPWDSDASITLELNERWEWKLETLNWCYYAALNFPDGHQYMWFHHCEEEDTEYRTKHLTGWRQDAARAIVRQAHEDGRL